MVTPIEPNVTSVWDRSAFKLAGVEKKSNKTKAAFLDSLTIRLEPSLTALNFVTVHSGNVYCCNLFPSEVTPSHELLQGPALMA
jgi:hypothetical protein